MARNYYYFVSGLPDLILDENKNLVPFEFFMEEAQEELHIKDIEIIRALRLPVDNANLIRIVESRHEKFDPRGNFSQEELMSSIRNPQPLPHYMQQFLAAHSENRDLFAGLIPEDQLNQLFFDWVTAHKNKFLREWFTFELNLSNILTAVNCRKNLEHIDALATDRDRAAVFTVIGQNEVTEAILRSSAPDFGLSSTLPWLERVLSLSKGNLTDMEKGIDQLRWETVDELTTFSYFQIETIAAFTIKLMIVERWLKLDPETGKAKLDRLVEDLKNSYSVPEGF
ncbi:V-type ATP synthase subunit C [Chitinispirillum alkaliphilum]|nr:V-type ATP synthase subunit C [Chitinispirillum alkaliphilum]